MTRRLFGSRAIVVAGIALAMTTLAPARLEAADSSKGSVVFQGKTLPLAFVYLVKGPDDMGNHVRELVFSPTDIAAKIQACANLSCVSGQLAEGMTVDFEAGPRLNYWVVANGQRAQHSGTVETDAFKASANEPGRLAGKLVFDDTSTGGGKADVTFDAGVAKEFKTAR